MLNHPNQESVKNDSEVHLTMGVRICECAILFRPLELTYGPGSVVEACFPKTIGGFSILVVRASSDLNGSADLSSIPNMEGTASITTSIGMSIPNMEGTASITTSIGMSGSWR